MSLKFPFTLIVLFAAILNLLRCEAFLLAQSSGSLVGEVVDAQSGRPIPDVNVALLGTTLGDVTDSSGTFHLSRLPAGTYSVEASIIGFQSHVIESISIREGERRILNFSLKPALIQLDEVQIEAERLWDKYLTEASTVGVERMSSEEVSLIPGALDDPIRAVQIFSGVSGGGDYSGFLAVRGGSPDQNQVIIDGVVVPNPYRFRLAFGGAMSTIDPNTTEGLYLHLGGFSAEYGNSLGSVLEVQSRTGNRDQIRTQGSLNFTDVGGLVEGPLPGRVGSYLFSVRRTYYDLIVNEISESSSVFPFFFEIKSKWALDLSQSNRVVITFSRNREGAELLNELSENVNLTEKAFSNFASLAWQKLHGDKWQFNTTLSFYNDHLDYRAFSPDSTGTVQEYETIDSETKNLAFKQDVRYQSSDKSWLHWGVTATSVPSKIDFNSAGQRILYARTESPKSIAFDQKHRYYATYLESSSEVSEKVHLRVGARYDYSTLIDAGEISPRFSIWYKLNRPTTIKASWGIFYQYPNPVSVYTRNIPLDLSANLDIISAEKATHQMAAIERDLGSNISARLQLYNIEIDRLLLPQDEVTYAPVNGGVGVSRGFEVILDKKHSSRHRFSGMLSYAFGRAKYRSINEDKWSPFKYDRRHSLTLFSNIKLIGNWSFSLLGQYSSGLPFTDVLGARNWQRFNGDVRWEFIRGPRFGARLPAVKKIDMRLSYQRRIGGKAFVFYVDLINVTNERNIQEITWENKFPPDGNQQAIKSTIYQLPMIPSFGVSFRL